MANWKQVQARIRKAKASPEAATALADLYEKTRDAMVAYELAGLAEKSEQKDEAVRWYTTAWERFRRDQWKKRAAEALERLGAPVPAAAPAEHAPAEHPAEGLPPSLFAESEAESGQQPLFAAPTDEPAGQPASAEAGEAPQEGALGRKRRRRGRRGGRGRRKKGAAPPAATAAPAPAPTPVRPPAASRRAAASAPASRDEARPRAEPPPAEPDRLAVGSAWAARAGSGDPALSSRLAFLDSRLRRLLACPLHRLDEADTAPAGPGVFLVSESDGTSYYYAEACRTLRVAIGQLARAGRGPESVRKRLAEHLEISDTHAGKYLKEHCAVRWIQMEEEGGHLAHFVIAVLRPALND